MPKALSDQAATRLPRLGLVCITIGDEVRYRTITRTRTLALSEAQQRETLSALYRDNLQTLFGAVDYCVDRGIWLYRCTSNLFPQVDHPVGKEVLESLADAMAPFAAHAERRGVRVVLHPDQFVVLNSDSPQVRVQSVGIMQDHARIFDLLNLPQTAWTTFIIHGGKGDRAAAMVEAIQALPPNIKTRLALENDERCYGSQQILDVCQAAGVPMIFDAHHHLVREKLDSYEHESVARFTRLSRDTWPDAAWHLVHLSNGLNSLNDPRHSDLITTFPSAFLDVPWVEVEAKGKEQAIDGLVKQLASDPPQPPKKARKKPVGKG